MVWCVIILEQVENSTVRKDKRLEHLSNKNKALQTQVDELNKAHTLVLSDLSKLSEETKNLDTMLSN